MHPLSRLGHEMNLRMLVMQLVHMNRRQPHTRWLSAIDEVDMQPGTLGTEHGQGQQGDPKQHDKSIE
jgi:hypothetical protein